MSLSDGKTHTITVNYLPPGTCTSGCKQCLRLHRQHADPAGDGRHCEAAEPGEQWERLRRLYSRDRSQVQNNDIVSWSFSSLPLAPITINQPLQSTQTQFNYTPTLTAVCDYSQSGWAATHSRVCSAGHVQTITDSQLL